MRGVRPWPWRFMMHPGVFLCDMKTGAPIWPSMVLTALAHCGTGVYLSEAILPDLDWLPTYIAAGAVVAGAIAVALLVVLHAVARVLGGRGEIRDLARLWGYTHLPEMATGIVLAAILRATVFRVPPRIGSSVGWLVGLVIVAVVTALWSLVLSIQAIRVVYQRSVLAAALVLALFGMVSGAIGGLTQLAVQTVGVRTPVAARLMDSMDPRLGRDVRAIAEKEMAIAAGLHVQNGTMYVPVNTRSYPPKRGDVVVFCRNGRTRNDVKRIAMRMSFGLYFGRNDHDLVADVGVARVLAVGGDIAEVRAGLVVLNGEQIEEPYVTDAGGLTLGPVSVPEGSFFLLGDNRRLEPDSYGAGVVDGDRILGRMMRTWAEIAVPVARLLLFG